MISFTVYLITPLDQWKLKYEEREMTINLQNFAQALKFLVVCRDENISYSQPCTSKPKISWTGQKTRKISTGYTRVAHQIDEEACSKPDRGARKLSSSLLTILDPPLLLTQIAFSSPCLFTTVLFTPLPNVKFVVCMVQKGKITN